MPTIRIIGPGRAGRSFALALSGAGWAVLPLLGRDDDVRDAASGVDVLLLATPDDAVASVAAAVRPNDGAVVVHLAGALGPDVLFTHRRRAALHPLVSLPGPEEGARRLRSGVTFALSGDPFAGQIVRALGGSALEMTDAVRPLYHAAACVASNHLVALLGQVERIAALAGLELGAFLPLAKAALDDVARVGPSEALTGPAARGDTGTIARHLEALPDPERPGYLAGVDLVRRLAAGEG